MQKNLRTQIYTLLRRRQCNFIRSKQRRLFSSQCKSERVCKTEDSERPEETRISQIESQYTLHFRNSPRKHPLGLRKVWTNPMVHHIWSPEELDEACKYIHRKPKSFLDKCIFFAVRNIAYKGFNFFSRYDVKNPTAKSTVWRLIFLESFAGVPGMVAGCSRHFRSLRKLQRDNGWIHTLLEEAENERMHLLVVLQMFNASLLTRTVVCATQFAVTMPLFLTYLINPRILHRFVGYLEETAVYTYSQIIDAMETPGTHLNKEWSDLKAPEIAMSYWHLEKNSKWLDVVKVICADESHHRDVNHTFANMEDWDTTNPYIDEHIEDCRKAWQRDEDCYEEGDAAKRSMDGKSK